METDRGLDLLEVASRCFEPESYRIRQGLRAILKYKIQYPTLTPRVEVLPYAVITMEMNSPTLISRVGELPDAINHDGT